MMVRSRQWLVGHIIFRVKLSVVEFNKDGRVRCVINACVAEKIKERIIRHSKVKSIYHSRSNKNVIFIKEQNKKYKPVPQTEF